MSKTRAKVQDFLAMGVQEVWVVDPATRSVLVCSGSTTVEPRRANCVVPDAPVSSSTAEVFAAIDDY